MPGTNEEFVELVIRGLPVDFPEGIRWADGTAITSDEALDVRSLADYRRDQIAGRRKADGQRKAQRKALRLLRSFLDDQQRAMLQRSGHFIAVSPNGSTYRVDASRGRTERVSRHGKRWFVTHRFCVHDDQESDDAMPPADLALTHLLMIQADEESFLGTANATDAGDMLWNGNWLCRLREARAQRAENVG